MNSQMDNKIMEQVHEVWGQIWIQKNMNQGAHLRGDLIWFQVGARVWNRFSFHTLNQLKEEFEDE